MSDTFSVAAELDDGYVHGFGASYPPSYVETVDANTSFAVIKNKTSFEVGVGLIRFDTSAISDTAEISSAQLVLYLLNFYNSDNRQVIGDWYSWTPHMGSGDYTASVGNDAISGVALSTIGNGSRSFSLQNLANINRSGYTGLRLGISGGAPTVGNNGFSVRSYSYPGGPIPQLVVNYATGETLTISSETDTAQSLTAKKKANLALADEIETAFALKATYHKLLVVASEDDVAQVVKATRNISLAHPPGVSSNRLRWRKFD